jgi:hypothetical protein
MGASTKKIFQLSNTSEINANNINKGNPIYYENVLHYIVYEFDDNMLISLNEDLTRVFCVKKSKTSIKPVKK